MKISIEDLMVRFQQVKNHAQWKGSFNLRMIDSGDVIIFDEETHMPSFSETTCSKNEMLQFLNGYSHCLNAMGV